MSQVPSALSQTAVFSPLDTVMLVAAGLASPVDINGTRRIHKRRLNRSSDEDHKHISLASISSTEAATAFVDIPDDLISHATLQYLGYNSEAASRLWQGWTEWSPGPIVREIDDSISGIPFIDFAIGYVNGRHIDAATEDDQDWFQCMDTCGIATELQEAIMDPIFRHVRSTKSCIFWITDTMQMRYLGLQEVQRTSREREMALGRARVRPFQSTSRTGGGDKAPTEVGTSSTSTSDTAESVGHRFISATQRSAPSIERETAMSAAAVAAENAPGHTILWKGMAQVYTEGTYISYPATTNVTGLYDNNGNVARLSCLASLPRTDFCKEQAYYFAVDKDVAIYYANYAKRRDTINSVVIVRMAIPNSAIEGLSDTSRLRVYWPDTEWKKLVFRCRRGDRLSTELVKFRAATLITGHIAGKPNLVFQRLDSADQITESMVHKNQAGRHSVQYVFPQDSGGEEFLEKYGAPSLSIYPLTAKEHKEWMYEMRAEPDLCLCTV